MGESASKRLRTKAPLQADHGLTVLDTALETRHQRIAGMGAESFPFAIFDAQIAGRFITIIQGIGLRLLPAIAQIHLMLGQGRGIGIWPKKASGRPRPCGQSHKSKYKGANTAHVLQNVQKTFPVHKGNGEVGKFPVSKGLAGAGR